MRTFTIEEIRKLKPCYDPSLETLFLVEQVMVDYGSLKITIIGIDE